jgi:hypothetical protein
LVLSTTTSIHSLIFPKVRLMYVHLCHFAACVCMEVHEYNIQISVCIMYVCMYVRMYGSGSAMPAKFLVFFFMHDSHEA